MFSNIQWHFCIAANNHESKLATKKDTDTEETQYPGLGHNFTAVHYELLCPIQQLRFTKATAHSPARTERLTTAIVPRTALSMPSLAPQTTNFTKGITMDLVL